jgi:hypothetical protein
MTVLFRNVSRDHVISDQRTNFIYSLLHVIINGPKPISPDLETALRKPDCTARQVRMPLRRYRQHSKTTNYGLLVDIVAPIYM